MICMTFDSSVCLAVLLSLAAGSARSPAAPRSDYRLQARYGLDDMGNNGESSAGPLILDVLNQG